MIACPNCGTSNADGSRFCSNCGASLGAVDSAGAEPAADDGFARPSPMPPPVELPAPRPPASDPEWRMSDPGPLPPPRGRRKWLWILGGVLGACILLCCAGGVWINTIGRDTVCGWATEAAEVRTPAANDDDAEELLAEFCND